MVGVGDDDSGHVGSGGAEDLTDVGQPSWVPTPRIGIDSGVRRNSRFWRSETDCPAVEVQASGDPGLMSPRSSGCSWPRYRSRPITTSLSMDRRRLCQGSQHFSLGFVAAIHQRAWADQSSARGSRSMCQQFIVSPYGVGWGSRPSAVRRSADDAERLERIGEGGAHLGDYSLPSGDPLLERRLTMA